MDAMYTASRIEEQLEHNVVKAFFQQECSRQRF